MSTETERRTRLHYIDSLRTALVALVIAHHAAQAYGPTGGSWPISNPVRSDILGPFFPVNAAFFMGLLFLISGYFTAVSLRNKDPRRFLKDRARRLGLPVLTFALLIFGPFAYLGRENLVSFGDFLSQLYRGGWQELYGHLWFVLHLLLYSSGYILWRRLQSASGADPTTAALPTHRSILLFTVVLTGITWIVRIWYPIDRWVPLLFLIPSEVAHLPQYLAMFAIGTYAARADWFTRMPNRTGYVWLGVGLTAAVARYVYPLVDLPGDRGLLAGGGVNAGSFIWSAWESLICVGLSVGLIVLFRTVLSKKPVTWVAAVNASAYGAYIIHLFVVLGIQLGFATSAMSPFLKFILVTTTGVPLSFGLAFGLRKVPGLRRVL